MQPPTRFEEIGDFGTNPLSPLERDRRAAFALLWAPVREWLLGRGWKGFGAGAVVELYVTQGASEVLERIWLSPTGGSFRVRLDAIDKMTHRRLLAHKDKLRPSFPATVVVAEKKLKRGGADVLAIDVQARLRDLLGNADSAEEMARRICAFVVYTVEAAEVHGRAA